MARKPTGRAARGRKPGAGPPPLYEWDRRPMEGPEAYQTFLAYRDMGPTRSLERLRQRWTEAGPSDRAKAPALSQLKEWSSRWTWSFRVDAWDAYLQRARDEAIRAVLTDQVERHRILGEAAFAAVSEALNLLIERLRLKGAEPPAFAAVMAAADTVVSLQQKIAAAAVERLERAVGGGPAAGAREEIARRLERMAAARAKGRAALEAAQEQPPAVQALQKPADAGAPQPS